MKAIYIFSFLFICSVTSFAQAWTATQIETANTAKDVAMLTKVEKDAIMYINLARLYPQDFAKLELQYYNGPAKYSNYLKNSSYKASLLTELNKATPISALYFDADAYEAAKCFAIEQGLAGQTGHTRINCKKGNYAECCSYGMDTGLDIVMQWLIDHDVPSLGHRINCLNKSYKKIGLSVQYHKVWGKLAVADMIW